MTTLSPAQIAAVAKGAGFSGESLVIAVAVALAESSGRAEVVNAIGCVGLWQINQPVHVKAHPEWSRAWLQNPSNNARAAFVLSQGGKTWSPWEAYTNGSYRVYVNTARKAAGNPAQTPAAPPTAQPARVPGVGSLAGLVKLSVLLTDARTWTRLLYAGTGVALLIFAFMRMTGDNKLSDTTKAVVALAVTRGKAK